MLHGTDGEVETVVEDQAVRLGRRREGRKHLGRADGEEREESMDGTNARCRMNHPSLPPTAATDCCERSSTQPAEDARPPLSIADVG